MVVEGVNAIPAAIELADKYGTDMPIVRGVNAIINCGYSPAEQVYALMTRKRNQKTVEYMRHPEIQISPRLFHQNLRGLSLTVLLIVLITGKSSGLRGLKILRMF